MAFVSLVFMYYRRYDSADVDDVSFASINCAGPGRLIYLPLRVPSSLTDVCKPLATESFEFPRDTVLLHLPSANILLDWHLPGYAVTPPLRERREKKKKKYTGQYGCTTASVRDC